MAGALVYACLGYKALGQVSCGFAIGSMGKAIWLKRSMLYLKWVRVLVAGRIGSLRENSVLVGFFCYSIPSA